MGIHANLESNCQQIVMSVVEELESVLVERGNRLKLHPDRDGLIKGIGSALSAGLALMKPLAKPDFDADSVDPAAFPELCGRMHDVAARLEAAMDSAGGVVAQGQKAGHEIEMVAQLRAGHSKQQQQPVELERVATMELQNEILRNRVAQMDVLMEQQKVTAHQHSCRRVCRHACKDICRHVHRRVVCPPDAAASK